ncbi:MAG TPA: hypothetical protein VE650_19895, partial [Acetobacteraceae bacterium]|nr:hypothetical protein [Acetobacteraceae bacterium]
MARRLALVAQGGERLPSPQVGEDKGITCAVLPFAGDETLGDALAEDVLTELARFHNLTIAARGASFACRPFLDDTRRVARELGVQFVIEGALRRIGQDRVRITVRLLEGESGQVLASERLERTVEGLESAPEDVVQQITARMAPELDLAGMRRAERVPEAEQRVQERVLRARAMLWRGAEAEDATLIDAGLELARQAADREPRYAEAWHMLAFGHCI